MTNNFIKTLLLLLTLLAVQVNAANKVDALELASTIEEITNNSNIFTITPKNIINELPESFSLNSKGPGEYEWVFLGSHKAQGISWVKAAFQQNEVQATSPWELIQLQIAFPIKDADKRYIYDAIARKLFKLLGQPTYGNAQEPGKRVAWIKSMNYEFALQQGEFETPETFKMEKIVLFEVIILQGEGEM